MRKLLTLAVATTTIGMATAASAVSITPNGPSQADGTVSLSKSGVNPVCNKTHLVGTVTNGVAKITAATFASSDPNQQGFCNAVKATNLPWTVTATSTTTGNATGVAATTPIGPCGPGTLNGTYNNSTHVLTFTNQTLAGGCSVSGSLTTHDNALTIK